MIIGPAVVALSVYLTLSLQPGTYVSTSLLHLDRPTATAMQAVISSPAIADRVLSKYRSSSTGREEPTSFISRNVTVTDTDLGVRQGDRIYRVEVRHQNAHTAQSINSDLIDAWLETTVPGATERRTLEAELERLKLSTAANSKLIEQLRGETTALLAPNSMAGELATPISALITKRDQSLSAIAVIQNRLAGTARDVIVLPADLPHGATFVRKFGLTLLAAFAAVPLFFSLVILGRFFAPGRSLREVISGWFRRTG
jgi:hypothetical protein